MLLLLSTLKLKVRLYMIHCTFAVIKFTVKCMIVDTDHTGSPSLSDTLIGVYILLYISYQCNMNACWEKEKRFGRGWGTENIVIIIWLTHWLEMLLFWHSDRSLSHSLFILGQEVKIQILTLSWCFHFKKSFD